MVYFKKLFFAPFFLISFIFLLYQFRPVLNSTDFIFSLSINTFIELLSISALMILSSFFFVLFCAIANDWMIVLPVIIFAPASAFFVFGLNMTTAFFVLSFTSFLAIFLSLSVELKNYIDFKPGALFSSPVKRTCTFLIFAFSITYFLSITPIIQKEGFQIPGSLIDTAMKFIPNADQSASDPTQASPGFDISQLQIPQEQLDMLKQNPQFLKQYNINPKLLDSVTAPKGSSQKPQTVSDLTQNIVKKTLTDQFSNMIKPYLSFIPIILSVALFITFQSLISFLSILVSLLLWLTFFILEKTGFVSFTEEMRPVKKMVL